MFEDKSIRRLKYAVQDLNDDVTSQQAKIDGLCGDRHTIRVHFGNDSIEMRDINEDISYHEAKLEPIVRDRDHAQEALDEAIADEKQEG